MKDAEDTRPVYRWVMDAGRVGSNFIEKTIMGFIKKGVIHIYKGVGMNNVDPMTYEQYRDRLLQAYRDIFGHGYVRVYNGGVNILGTIKFNDTLEELVV